MISRRRFAMMVLLLASAVTFPATAATDGQRSAVEGLLAGIDTLPSRAQLLKVTPDVHTVLFALAIAPSSHAWIQERATSYLGLFADRSETWGYLVQLAENAPILLRATAISALTRGFLASRPQQLIRVLQNYLASSNVPVRRAAIWALSRVPHADALQALAGVTWEKRADLRALIGRRMAVLKLTLSKIKKR